MKFPYAMLRDFVNTTLDATEVGDLLTMAGFEVEGIEEVDGDNVFDVKVVSNRGDGLSVFGLAREVLAKDSASMPTLLYERADQRFVSIAKRAPSSATVTIECKDCNRFACRTWSGVKNGAAPELIRKRLEQAGLRSISLLVDLTNYVMLELGQPLHVFDFAKLRGGRIIVRQARAGERLTTLNGVDHELRPDQMVICDADRPVGAAGIMGGLETEVSESTIEILLESAHFRNTSVRRTRKQMGLNTDASYRFERSVDPEGVVAAIERFSELLGAEGSSIVDIYPTPPDSRHISLRLARATELLGMEISEPEAIRYLRRLGMLVVGEDGLFTVTPPSWRPDIQREIDIVEELGRIHGYDRIPEKGPFGSSSIGGPQGSLLAEDLLRQAIVRAGYVQTISHSLGNLHALDAASKKVGPRTPSSPDMAFLRNSLLPNLADAAIRNGAKDLHLFEIGNVFSETDGALCESKELAMYASGNLVPTARKGEAAVSEDIFSVKSALTEALATIGFTTVYVASDGDGRFHPTRCAGVQVCGVDVGLVGQIHPQASEASSLPDTTILATLNLTRLFTLSPAAIGLRSISRQPPVRRDIAVLVDKSIPYEALAKSISSSAGPVLERQWLFDVFEGQGIPAGKHSLGIGMQFRKLDGTFTDEEANQVRDSVVKALAEHGATTR